MDLSAPIPAENKVNLSVARWFRPDSNKCVPVMIPSGPGDRANSPSRDHANIRHASRGPDGLRQLLPELKLR